MKKVLIIVGIVVALLVLAHFGNQYRKKMLEEKKAKKLADAAADAVPSTEPVPVKDMDLADVEQTEVILD